MPPWGPELKESTSLGLVSDIVRCDDLCLSDYMKKISRAEALRQGFKYYFTGKPCKNGHVSERYTKRSTCLQCNREQALKAHYKYRGKRLKQKSEYRERNRDEINDKERDYYLNNKHKRCSWTSARRDSQSTATPSWLSTSHKAQIHSIYREAQSRRDGGEDVHVDHIVPLRGEIVCGLHVPWNLRIIDADENLSKGAKVE